MSEWKLLKLKNITSKIGSGATPRGGKESYHSQGISLIRSQNVLDYHFSYDGLVFIDPVQANELRNVEIKPKDILLNITGDSVARVCMVPDEVLPARVNQHVAIIRLDQKVAIPEYVLYFLLDPTFKKYMLRIASHGGTRNALTKADIENFLIKLPTPSEQHSIASILSNLDQKISLLHRQNQTLEQIARALFKRWFVEFEFPFDFAQGKPNEHGQPYKSSGGKMAASELGEIPEGWRVGRLGDEFDILMGQSPPGESYNENGEGKIFFQGRTDFGFRFPSIRLYTTQPKRIAEKFDVLVSVRAPVGDVNVALEKCCIGRGLSAVKSNYQSYCLYKVKSLGKIFDRFESEGTVFGALNKDNFNNIENIIPPNGVIRFFDEIVHPIDDKIYVNEKEIQNLTIIRDTLLPKLMSGQIRVAG